MFPAHEHYGDLGVSTPRSKRKMGSIDSLRNSIIFKLNIDPVPTLYGEGSGDSHHEQQNSS